MTPEEKASELINKFWPFCYGEIDTKDEAVACSIICVKELIEMSPKNYYRSNMGNLSMEDYWKQVLKHLESK